MMKHSILVGLLCLQPAHATAPATEGDEKNSVPMNERLAALVESYCAAGRFSGTVYVARGDEVLLERAFGPADSETGRANTVDTRVQIGSITKPLVSAAILRLVDAGRLDLDDTLAEHLPEFSPSWAERVTLRQILLHRAAIARDFSRNTISSRGFPGVDGRGMDRAGLFTFLDQRLELLDIEPGSKTVYSNSGYRLLAMVIEEELGMDYGLCMEQLVFKPARMMHTSAMLDYPGGDDGAFGHNPFALGTSFQRDPKPQHMIFARGCGDVAATAADLGQFARVLLGEDFLSEESARLALTAEPGERTIVFERAEVEFEGEATTELWHAGGFTGFSAHFLCLPEPRVFVSVLGNVDAAPSGQIANELVAVLDGREPELLRPFGPELLEELSDGDFEAARELMDDMRTPSNLLVIWGPTSATGAPDVPIVDPVMEVGGLANAWVPAASDSIEWLELFLAAEAVEAQAVRIVGWSLAIVGLDGVTPDGQIQALSIEDTKSSSDPMGRHQLDIKIAPGRSFSGFIVHMDSERVAGYPAIDAAGFLEADETVKWALEARASSSQMSHALRRQIPDVRFDPQHLEEGARDLFDQGRDEEALALLKFSMDYFPRGARGAEALARGYLRVGRPDDATPLLERVLSATGGRRAARTLLDEIRASEPD